MCQERRSEIVVGIVFLDVFHKRPGTETRGTSLFCPSVILESQGGVPPDPPFGWVGVLLTFECR